MSLQEQLCGHIKEVLAQRNELMYGGMSSAEAINICGMPSKFTHLNTCLMTLSINQLDKIVDVLCEHTYLFPKGLYKLNGITISNGHVMLDFYALALLGDDMLLPLEELPEQVINDLTEVIRKVI